MFKRLDSAAEGSVRIYLDDQEVIASSDDTVASALLAAGIDSFRKTPVSGSERGPYCMMGACFDCLIEIDGVSIQACTVPVSPGLRVYRVPGAGPAARDPA